MNSLQARSHTPSAPSSSPASAVKRLGCVSFLNARPLIEGLDQHPDADVRYDVPARLLHDLETGRVDLALCPVIDYHRAARPLTILPVGGIGCEGPTLTVRLFCQRPLHRVSTVHADMDSHTSVVLLQILLHHLHNLRPAIEPHPVHVSAEPPSQTANQKSDTTPHPEAMLLIGDKVVRDAPDPARYPYRFDLGQMWYQLTGLPFVFAVWMTPDPHALGDLPQRLHRQRLANAPHAEAIAERHAHAHGWPLELAREYLARILRYQIGSRELEAIRRFSQYAADLQLIPRQRPLSVHRPTT